MKINIVITKQLKIILISILAILLMVSIVIIKLCFDHKIAKQDINDEEIILDDITEISSFPKVVYGVPVNTTLVKIGTKARPGTKRKIKYIVIHDTDNSKKGAGAKNHAEFLNSSSTSDYTSWHYTVDDQEIYHHIPDNEVAYHAASNVGNFYGIGIELCVNEDGDFEKTFENGAKLVAYLMKEYELDITAIKTHHDFSGKDCPHLILRDNRLEEFKEKVKEFL
ncbi:MAG: N-acetylmuramoyl-L-alanine amidase [Clostridia bacterium]|nr:N-acetylmuramoyl-L-alanine amidase [Clostridia bacterium]